MRSIGPLLLFLGLLALPACDPCTDYCEQECACGGYTEDGCVDTCLETLNVYSGESRAQECSDRLDVLEEECR